MAAGTLSVTNNSKAVAGVGTTFTAFKAGDFLSLVVGQVPYTVAIASIESDTALTLVLPFDGPSATDLAWGGIKRDTMSLATMGVTVQAQKALRLLIADENNWRAIFGDSEEITVTLPNGQVMQGMSWGYLSQLMKQIDPVEMRDLQQQAAASEAAAQGYRDEAEGFKDETAGIRDATNQIKADTQAIYNATNTIKTQTDQIKADTQVIKDQTNQIKTDTGVIRDEANTAKIDAQAARDAALGYRNEAEEWAKSVNVDDLLTKSGNLAGLTDKPQAWLNVRPDGATPLAGDPVNDYDAVTKRWVQNIINTGTVGPTMNGVMNYGVGDFHLRDSRAYIQPYEVVSDGQLLNRADWPELWAYAQMLSPIEDANWLEDPANRGKYSLGDGATTFRVPDRNGVQDGSVSSLFARGDGGISANNGMVYKAAVPNITGSVKISGGEGGFDAGAGSLTTSKGPNGNYYAPAGVGSTSRELLLDASVSDRVYGRDSIKDDVLPRNFVGVWVIRASGGFVAANTSWSVIDGGASEPVSGVTAYGGAMRSVYNIAGAEAYASQLRTKVLFGTDSYSVLEMKDPEGMREVMSVSSTGSVTVPGRGGFYVDNAGEPNAIELFNVTPNVSENTYVNMLRGHWYADRFEFGAIRDSSAHIKHVQLNIIRSDGNKYWAFKWSDSCIDTNLGLIQPGGSDRRLKDKITDITNTEGNTPSDRINRLVAREFEWLSDGRKDRGFVAQEAQEADKIYAFSGSISGMMNLNDRAILADVVAVLQKHDREISEAKAAIMEKENASLRANIAEMDERIAKLEALVRQLTGSEE